MVFETKLLIGSYLHDWFESYLTDRQQLTLVNNIMSDLLYEDVYGVSQGSVLGPLLFLLYIDDIKSVIQNAYCHLYTDDTIILNGVSDPGSLIESHWLSINKMTFNTQKAEVIFFGRNKAHLRKLNNKLSGIWILHSKENIKSNILEYFLLRKCNRSTKSETSPYRLICN